MRDLKMSKDFIVTVHNDLVQARFTDSLTINEQKILFAVLSNVEPPEFKKDEDGKRYIVNKINEIEPFRVSVKEFTQWLGVTDPNYTAFKKVIKRLMKKLIEIQQPDGSWEIFQWVTKASYIANTGTVEIKISPELYPYLINLENNFTTTKLNVLLSFKSRYSTRLYQLIKKWSKIGTWKVELDELKMLLGIPLISEKNGVKVFKLDKYSHFKERALMTAINEINTYSEFKVEINEHKKVRKVTAISFNIKTGNAMNKKTLADSPDASDKPIGSSEGQLGEEGNEMSTIYGASLLDRYNYRNNGVYDKKSDELVLLEDLERVQLIICNRKQNAQFNFSNDACILIEKELIKVVNHSDFDLSKETHFIFSYVDSANGLSNPEGFIVSKTKELVSRILKGEKVSFEDLFNTKHFRYERLPDWWFAREQSKRQEQEKTLKFRLLPDSILTLIQAKGIQLKLELSPDMDFKELPEHHIYEEYKKLDELYGMEKLIQSKELELKSEKVAV